jgi:hypothetical protein
MQILELLRENLEILFQAVNACDNASLIEETGSVDSDNYYALYELNDELFLFHFSRNTICRLIVFENVPSALDYLHSREA